MLTRHNIDKKICSIVLTLLLAVILCIGAFEVRGHKSGSVKYTSNQFSHMTIDLGDNWTAVEVGSEEGGTAVDYYTHFDSDCDCMIEITVWPTTKSGYHTLYQTIDDGEVLVSLPYEGFYREGTTTCMDEDVFFREYVYYYDGSVYQVWFFTSNPLDEEFCGIYEHVSESVAFE